MQLTLASLPTFISCPFLMYVPVMQHPIKFAVHYKKHHADSSKPSSSSVVQRTLLSTAPVSSLLLPEYYGWVPHAHSHIYMCTLLLLHHAPFICPCRNPFECLPRSSQQMCACVSHMPTERLHCTKTHVHSGEQRWLHRCSAFSV